MRCDLRVSCAREYTPAANGSRIQGCATAHSGSTRKDERPTEIKPDGLITAPFDPDPERRSAPGRYLQHHALVPIGHHPNLAARRGCRRACPVPPPGSRRCRTRRRSNQGIPLKLAFGRRPPSPDRPPDPHHPRKQHHPPMPLAEQAAFPAPSQQQDQTPCPKTAENRAVKRTAPHRIAHRWGAAHGMRRMGPVIRSGGTPRCRWCHQIRSCFSGPRRF